ncbi:MAG: serine hydrolase [Gemmatimonadales bacterium]|nr:serine hydrolase [Gemmatimonadales bacterium]
MTLALGISASVLTAQDALRPDRRVALTFDDLPATGSAACDVATVRDITKQLTGILATRSLPSAALVTPGRACLTPVRLREVLGRWREVGAVIGNHTATHLNALRRPGAALLTAAAQSPPTPRDTIARLVSQLDSLTPVWLEQFHVPGVAVAVVRRDTVLLLRGWGSADVADRAPVTPETAFRVASLSKVVTTTAALRLVEMGRLDRHADIAPYLEHDIPRRFAGPVTLHQLLTHTAGFDRSDVGDATPVAASVIPLDVFVSRHPEPQVLPPGFAHHYSNFGFALAGHLVERASGIAFAEYVRREVFTPLGMDGSTFAQPPPPAIHTRLAAGHAWDRTGFRRLPLDYTHVGPADALVTTARDMAAFLRFQLGEGESVLSQAMRDTMHATQYTASPTPYGMAYGLEENVMAKRRVLQHGGAQLGFTSVLVLFPDDDLGVFIAQNAREGRLRGNVLRVVTGALLDPGDTLHTPPPSPPSGAADVGRYAGRYRHTGYTHATFEKAFTVLGFRGGTSTAKAGAQPGTLHIDGDTWVHAPGLGDHRFVNARIGWSVRGFLVGADGRVTHHVSGREVLERVSWWEEKRIIQVTLLGTTALALAAVLLWPLVRHPKRRGEHPGRDESLGARRARGAVQVAALVWVLGSAGFFVLMSLVMNRDVQFDYGPSWELVFMLTLLQLAAIAALAVPVVTVLAWRRRWWSTPARLAAAVYAAASLAAVAALHYMNLIGYRW